jgi:hypothetical protein
MARRTTGLRNRKSLPKMDAEIPSHGLDYHEGLSANQVKIILREFGFSNKHLADFNEWMGGQTCPIVERANRNGGRSQVCGIYEYDLFRWIENQRKGTPLIWD